MILHAFTDGASRGNPGESGIGIILRSPEGSVLLEEHGYIGRTTNNMAEYTALLTLLERMEKFPCTHLVIHSDSELLVRQMRGQYKVKSEGLKELHRKALKSIASLPCSVELVHVPREQNRDADRLANQGVDSGVQARR